MGRENSRVTSVRLPADLLEKARDLGLNVSKVCENALREAVSKLEGPTPETMTNGGSPLNQKSGRSLDLDQPGESLVRTSACHYLAGHSSEPVHVLPKLDYGPMLGEFRDFLKIDRRLSDGTVRNHVFEISRFMEALGPEAEVSRRTIRAYLMRFQEGSPGLYKNVLSALKVFLRDFLNWPELVSSFKFPYSPGKIVRVVPTGDLRIFYRELEDPLAKAMFLMYASSGLRRRELLDLKRDHIDPERRMMVPGKHQNRTKRTYITFYNEEAAEVLEGVLTEDPEARIFPVSENYFRKKARKIRERTGVHITPQMLREWFCCEMGKRGVPDRYVDGFCGRVPQSVLAKHYTDFSPENLKEIYDQAGLKVLA